MEKIINVCVLMSTYNGEKFLREQIDSILYQKDVQVYLYVRDDCSSDNTINILEEYQKKGLLEYYVGKQNLGAAFSFLELLFDAPDYDYYAFADQDDVWLQDKLINAVQELEIVDGEEKLYHSCVEVVDEELNRSGKYFGAVKQYNFITELCRNNAVGCTFVFNRKLREVIREYKPRYISMHDQWIMLICLGVGGKIVLDSNAYILYRQHQNNAVGIKKDVLTKIKQSSLIPSEGHFRLKQAYELQKGYKKKLTKKNHKVLLKVFESQEKFWKRMSCILFKFNCEKIYMNWLCRYALIKKRF